MPLDERPHMNEGASVQVTPATPANPTADPNVQPAAGVTPPEESAPVPTQKVSPLQKIAGLLGAAMSLMLLASVACSPSTTPTHNEAAGVDDGSAAVQTTERPGWLPASVPFVSTGNPAEEPTHYNIELTLAKCVGEVAVCTPDQAYEVRQDHTNLLTTAGAGALWNGLSTSGLATPFSTTNAQLAVGDGTTAAAVGDTDLGAADGTKLNAADLTSCTNATPIVCSGTLSPAAVAGQVYDFAGFTGAGASAINGRFEASAGSASSITLLNSAGSGAITVTGATVKPVNYYRQQANGTGSAVVSTNQITYVATFGTTNANFHWQEWGLTTGAAATNKQASAPPTLFNHKIVDLGTKTSSASWTLTATLSLS